MKKIGFACLALGVFLALAAWQFQVTMSLVFGWVLFLVHTLPRMTVDGPSVFVGCLALAMFLLGVDAAGRTWRRNAPEVPR